MQGRTDIPLNTKGRHQAEEIAKHLKDVKFDFIYSSPLSRTHQTATIINSYHTMDIHHDDDLMERGFGILEGKPYKEINAYHAALLFSQSWNWPDYRPSGGESINEVKTRANRFTGRLLQGHKGKTVLVVSHGVTLRILTAILLGIPPALFMDHRLKNASLTLIELEDSKEPTLHAFNYLPL
jgi:broad specificity phosphatase PhoE